MRVALVGLFPEAPYIFTGGVETSTWNLIEGLLSQRDLEIHVVTTLPGASEGYETEVGGVQVHYLPVPSRLNTLTRHAVAVRRIRSRLTMIGPDVVHSQNSQIFGYACLGSGYPTVVSVHGIVSEEVKHAATLAEGLRDRLHARLQRKVVARAADLIQPTTYPEETLGHLGPGVWHDAGNAIADRFFNIRRVPDPGSLLYVGAVIRRKRLLDLVHSLADLDAGLRPRTSLRVAGALRDPAYLSEVKEISTTTGCPRIEFLGSLSQADLAREYATCHALILPSAQETSPMVIGEAMAAGVPVIATNVGGVAALLGSSDAGILVPPGDRQALTQAIARILSDPALTQRLGLAAKSAAMEMTGEAVARRVRAVYNLAVSRRPA